MQNCCSESCDIGCEAAGAAMPCPCRPAPPALMQDQVCSLQALGVAAEYLASSRTAAERKAVLARLTGPANGGEQLALLYVTPELLATDRCGPAGT